MRWKNVPQVEQALTDMYTVFCALPIEGEEFFLQLLHDYMWQRNNTSFYSFRIVKEFLQKAIQYGVDVKNSSILELGAGRPLGAAIFWNFIGAKKYTSIDKFTQVNLDDLSLKRFQSLLDLNLFHPNDFSMDSLIKKKGKAYILNENRVRFIQSSFEDFSLKDESFNFVYSGAVLEHVVNIQQIVDKMYQVMSDDGTAIHLIDLREHHTHLKTVPDKNTSIDFLTYSTEEWNEMHPPGSIHYINRLRASDFRKCFTEAGFKIVDFLCTQKMDIDDTI
ncbi:MAG: methyltransferase domain-containing protein, partial [Thermodesulfobacteriota bacterium]|nr:methyltransferase domain-containing protein [Thermodesulfobacteriota bacterium]